MGVPKAHSVVSALVLGMDCGEPTQDDVAEILDLEGDSDDEPEDGAGSQPLDPAGVESTQPDDDEVVCVERPPLFVLDVESSDEVSVM